MLLETQEEQVETLTELHTEGRPGSVRPRIDILADAGGKRDHDGYAEWWDFVITTRNGVMADRLGPILAEGGVFVSVGLITRPGRTASGSAFAGRDGISRSSGRSRRDHPVRGAASHASARPMEGPPRRLRSNADRKKGGARRDEPVLLVGDYGEAGRMTTRDLRDADPAARLLIGVARFGRRRIGRRNPALRGACQSISRRRLSASARQKSASSRCSTTTRGLQDGVVHEPAE